jgi:ABC-2 type transport system ATP-binding protein
MVVRVAGPALSATPDPRHRPVALAVEDVTKRYVQTSLLAAFGRQGHTGEKQALRGVSFELREGETLGLLGPNGAGKTTLLKIISTLITPNSGRVTLFGCDVLRDPRRARGMMGLVTCDERSFYWRLTGRHNLRFFATLYGVAPHAVDDRIAVLLEALGLTDAADRAYFGYSSGMKQKLAIARGLLAHPRLVLYDEPTRSLDPVSTQNIRRWIVEQRKSSPGQTHLIATNQLEEAEMLCDRVVIVNRGVLIAHGTIDEIRERWHRREYEVHRVTFRGSVPAAALGAAPADGLLEVVEEEVNGDETTLRLRTTHDGHGLTHLLGVLLHAGATVVRCERETVPFDEVFCALVLGDDAAERASIAAGGGR